MLNLSNETPLSLTEATKILPALGGRRLHPSSVWRWARKGVRGVRLEYARLGHRVVTTREALARFAARLAEADTVAADEAAQLERLAACQVVTPKSRTQKQRERDIETARRECAAAGII